MLSVVLSRLIILVAGVLYPAYCSFKAIKTRNMKAYVRWMIYWIVYALYSSIEVVTDMFVSWIPFYYEIKILTVLWLVSPATRGCVLFFKRFMQPVLDTREREIDSYIASIGAKGYRIVQQLGSNFFSFAFSSLVKGHMAVMEHVKNSYFQVQVENMQSQISSVPATDVDQSAADTTTSPVVSSSAAPAGSRQSNVASDVWDSGNTRSDIRSSSALKSSESRAPAAVLSYIPTTTSAGLYDNYSTGRSSRGYSRSAYQPSYDRPIFDRRDGASVGSSQLPPVEASGSYYDRYVKSRAASMYSSSTRSTSSASIYARK